ncbi:MAG: SCO family protein [Verrucomicrobiales bacterium]|nr:SCO family protein [Verrucomicrobiales bacterium]
MVALSLGLLGCGADDQKVLLTEDEVVDSDTLAKLFKVRGIVQEIKRDEKLVVVDHEEIPDYMGAMIMPFRVKDLAELIGLEPGDGIVFDYRVEELQSWIENVQVTGKKGAVKMGSKGAATVADGEVLPMMARLSDYAFVDETGEEVSLADYRGGVTALTFVFTRCPVPEYCPAMMRKFHEASIKLKKTQKGLADWTLLTISFDVAYDSPEVMKAWGKHFGFELGGSWHLLSAKKGSDTIEKIAADVGLKFGDNQGSYQHNLRTVVLDGRGRIRKVFTDENWTVEELLEAMKAAKQEPMVQ